MDEKLRGGKNYFFFTMIAGIILLAYIVFVSFHFEDAILYLGEKPYQWSENPSTWFYEELSWFRVVGSAVAPACLGRLVCMKKRPWSLAECKEVTWMIFIMGVVLMANGIYELNVYHGRELYTFDGPYVSSAGETYVFDTFMYLPMAFAAVETAGGLWALYKLYLKKSVED
ncbi:hypothetical protein [Emergencia timonensis]|uniref:hypothetical protein n=1 Tax=Emergencia timonensis TaxID=1776384 RepID=UPI0039940FB9